MHPFDRIKHKILLLSNFTLLATTFGSAQESLKYEENWESLNKVNEAPNWFKDAKFGIYAHWGPVSSAFEGTDPNKFYAGWHGMKMYEDGVKAKTKSGKNR